jgi:hypothetical protein
LLYKIACIYKRYTDLYFKGLGRETYYTYDYFLKMTHFLGFTYYGSYIMLQVPTINYFVEKFFMNKTYYEYFTFDYGIKESTLYLLTGAVMFSSLWVNFFLLLAIEFDDKRFSRHFHMSNDVRKP